MKPRLIKFKGVWHCGFKNHPWVQFYGLGMSPAEAYADWIKFNG